MSIRASRARRAVLMGLVAVTGLGGCTWLSSLPFGSSGGEGDAPSTVQAAPGARHVQVIGDSHTTGTGCGGLGERNWVSLARTRLAPGTSIDADAEGGAGYVRQGMYGHRFVDLVARSVDSGDAEVALVGSLNDYGLSGRTRTAADAALDLVAQRAPDAKVLVVGPLWTPTPGPDAEITAVDSAMRAAAQAHGARYVSGLDWFRADRSIICADDDHPTDAGHAHLADLLTPEIAAPLG